MACLVGPSPSQSDHDPDAVEDVEISPKEITTVPVPPGRVSLGMSSLDEVQLDRSLRGELT